MADKKLTRNVYDHDTGRWYGPDHGDAPSEVLGRISNPWAFLPAEAEEDGRGGFSDQPRVIVDRGLGTGGAHGYELAEGERASTQGPVSELADQDGDDTPARSRSRR